MTMGKVAMPVVQGFVTLAFSLLLLAVSQQANAQQKFEFKFNLKDVLPTGNHEAPPTQPSNNPESITENRPESPTADVQSWINKFKSCTAEILAMQIDGSHPYPASDCASGLEREFLDLGLADSKVACLDQTEKERGIRIVRRAPREMMTIMRAGSGTKRPKSNCRINDVFCRSEQDEYRCHQNWPYRSLYTSWSEMYRAQHDVSQAMNAANRDYEFRQEYAQLKSEENAALAQWQSKSIRPGPASLCDGKRCDIGVDVIQVKADKVLMEIEVCAKSGEVIETTKYYSKFDGSYVGEKDESIPTCFSYEKAREWVDRSSIRPSGWKYDNSHHTIPCKDRYDWGLEKNRACWRTIREDNMKMLK